MYLIGGYFAGIDFHGHFLDVFVGVKFRDQDLTKYYLGVYFPGLRIHSIYFLGHDSILLCSIQDDISKMFNLIFVKDDKDY